MIATLAVFGAGSEFLQHFMPGRTTSLSDGVANMAGVGVALLIVWLIATRAAATAPQPEENRQAS